MCARGREYNPEKSPCPCCGPSFHPHNLGHPGHRGSANHNICSQNSMNPQGGWTFNNPNLNVVPFSSSSHVYHPTMLSNIHDADHRTLMAASNDAYLNLYQANMRLQAELDAERRQTQLRFLNLPPQVQRAAMSAPVPLRPPSPPLLLTESNYPDVKFWKREQWNKFLQSRRDRKASPKKTDFLCGRDGDSLSEERIREMGVKLREVLNQLHHDRLDPGSWDKRNETASKYVCSVMRKAFEEFCYGDGDWKVHVFVRLRYPDWVRTKTKSHGLTRSEPLVMKRKCEEDADQKPKRSKYNIDHPAIQNSSASSASKVCQAADLDDPDDIYGDEAGEDDRRVKA